MQSYRRYSMLLACLGTFLLTGSSGAGDHRLEQRLQRALQRSGIRFAESQALPAATAPNGTAESAAVKLELGRLKQMRGEIREANRLLDEKFERQWEKIKDLGPKARERHARMLERYRATMSKVEALLAEENTTPETLSKLESLVSRDLHRPGLPIYGTLPYKHVSWPARKPDMEPSITPAYLGGSQEHSPDDLQSTTEAPITQEIAEFAESQGWDPARIYNYVMMNVETEWYWGCMKGALETLRQGSGNDCDQAALLVALLRASGYHSRYVRGVIEFFPDLEKAKNLTGVQDESDLGEFFQKAGIPFEAVISGGQITNYRIEHIWVETRVPYSNYRGAVVDEEGRTWLGLDTSIKPEGYTYNDPEDLPEGFPIDDIRDYYLQADRLETPLEYLRAEVEIYLDQNQPETAYEDLLLTRTREGQDLKILPASMQFKEASVTHEYLAIPEDLFHKARFLFTDISRTPMFDITFNTFDLSNRSIAMTYDPDTVEDLEIINSFGGLDNTPAYLVRLRPVLNVNGEKLAIGHVGLPMGGNALFTIELISPYGMERITNDLIVGNLIVTVLVAQIPVMPETLPPEEKSAERLLYEEALSYIGRWHQSETHLASLLRMAVARPLPSVLTMGGVIDVTYVLDMPHGYAWKGAFVDADLRTVEITGKPCDCGTFMQLSALQGSVLEDRILREDFQVDSISTARLFGIAQSNQIPILTIDAGNIDTVLPVLPFAENVKDDIANSVNQGLTISVLDRELSFEDWLGVGYLKENLETGESGWMLTGMIAGGMTAWGADKWEDYYRDRLENPFAEPPSYDPDSAVSIQKLSGTDMQMGTVGMQLEQPLQVIVRDVSSTPIAGVDVTLSVKAGGGGFGNGQDSIVVQTDNGGIASAEFILGEKTSDSPAFMWETGGAYHQQVGENLIDAELPSGTSTTRPFTEYGLPDLGSASMRKVYGDGFVGIVLYFAGCIQVVVEDEYGNPISNMPVDFSVQSPIVNSSCTNPSQDNTPAVLFAWDDQCISGIPIHGQCASESDTIQDTTSHIGAFACVILGGTPEAYYPIMASSSLGDLSTEFILETVEFGNCNGNSLPEYRLFVSSSFHMDESGNIYDAAKAGATFPVRAKMYFLRENERLKGEVSFVCLNNGQSLDCPGFVGTREYFIDTNLVEPEVMSTILVRSEDGAQEVNGTYDGNGMFSADYTLAPGANVISIDGHGTIVTTGFITDCDAMTCELDGIYSERNDSITITLYGVDIQTEPGYSIQVDNAGFAMQDTVIEYEILPAEYNAILAYVAIMKDGDPIVFIASEEQGIGTVTISRGFKFDLDSTYEAQVVLNAGTENEIRSDRIPLNITRNLFAEKIPFVLERTHHNAEFDTGGPPATDFTDGFKILKFSVSSQSSVNIHLLDEGKARVATLVEDMELPNALLTDTSNLAYVIDYATVSQHVNPSINEYDFFVQVESVSLEDGDTQTVEIPGRLVETRQGFMLGTMVAHDVRIADGSLSLTREDFKLKGRGPDLSFMRSYTNRGPVRGDGPLGGGWSHNFEKRVTALRSTSMLQDGPLPQWVVGLKQEGVFDFSATPDTPETWNQVSINGAQFRNINGDWQVERGRRAKLVQEADEFVFTAMDGTRYYFGIPDDFPYRDFPSGHSGSIAGGDCEDKSRLRRIVDRNGNELTLTYDALCRITEVSDAVDRKLRLHYTGVNSKHFGTLSVIERIELVDKGMDEGIDVVRYSYNDEGFLERVERDVSYQGSLEYTWYERYEYERERPNDSFDYNLVASINANEEMYQYEYHQNDELGYSGDLYGAELKDEDVVKSVSYPAAPDIHTATFAYDFSAKTRTVDDLRGYPTTYTLNEFGNPLRIVEPAVDGGQVKTTDLQWSIDQGRPGNDMVSRIVTNVTAQGSETRSNQFSYVYDVDTRTETRTDPNEEQVVTIFDANFNVPLNRTDRNGNSESWLYDPTGNLLVYTDADSKTTTYSYNSFGEREKKTRQGNSMPTGYTYDAYGNLDTVTEPEGSSRDLDHDLWGRLVRDEDPHGNVTLNSYDSIGRLREVEYQPQNLSDLIASGPQHLELVKTIEYDPAGNKILETDRNGLELRYTYTARGQVDTVHRKGDSVSYGLKTYQYDPNGNVLAESDWLGELTTHTYDQRNRRNTTTNRLGIPMFMEYDTVGNLVETTDYAGNVTRYNYDRLDRETSRTVLGEGGGTVSRTYYDEEDSRKNLKTVSDQEGKTTTFEYNGRYLVTRIVDPLQADKGGLSNPDMGHRLEYDEKGNKNREIDAEDNETSYEYDQEDRLVATERKKKEGGFARTEYDYSEYISSKKVVATDPLGKPTQTFYDPWNRVKRIVDANGYEKESWYDGEGNIVLMRDGRGLERRWERDRRGLVLEYYDAVAVATPTYRYEYNHNDRLTKKFRFRGDSVPAEYIETETSYDAEDREKYVIEAKGSPEQRTMHYLSRDGMGNPLEVLDYNGNSTNYEYNAVYKVKREVDSKGNAIEYEYYPTTRLQRKIDKRIAAEPRTTTYEYDLLDREKSIEDPLLQSTQKTYDDVGNLLTVTDKRGIVTEHEYDSLYRRTRTIRASQQVERKEYNDVGRVIAEYDAYDRLVREFEYNDRHLLAKTIFRNDGAVTTDERREYDGNGNLTELVDEEGKPTTYTHDGENRQLTATFEGEITTRTYDKIGNLTSLTLPEGAPGGKFAGTKKDFGYDAHNRLTRVEEEELAAGSGGLVTGYTYDKNGNLQNIYDPRNNHVEYQYDDLDRRIRHIQHKDAGDLVTRFEYSGVGNLIKVTDAKGQQFDYEYDLLNRRVGSDYPDVPSPLLRLAEIDFGYDANSNLKTVTETKYEPGGSAHVDTIVNTYDQFDRLDDSTRRGVLIDYTYDNNGNRLSVSTPNHSTSYTYTLRNWVKTATLSGQTTNFDYLPDGKLDTVSYPNGTQADYNYHPTNRIQNITHTNTGGTLYSYSYTYDKNGNRETQAEFNDGVSENTTYEYDPMNRLTAYTITGHSDPFRREYTYEGYNRKTEKTFVDGTLTEDKEYFYDQTNWLTKVATAAYFIDYTYDKNGNTLTKVDSRTLNDPIKFQYSARDRLVQVKKGSPGAEQILGQFDYNHEGNRVRHRLSDRGDVDYYYDDGAVIEERNAADDSLLAYYQYADRLIALAQPAGTQYYHHDALGSTIGLTDATGADKKSYHLDPWGNIRWETGTSDNRHVFTGKEHDKNTGLVYFGARYYDPEVGRFITQDTYLGKSDTPPSLHRYLYAYSNPTVYIDLHGHQAVGGSEEYIPDPKRYQYYEDFAADAPALYDREYLEEVWNEANPIEFAPRIGEVPIPPSGPKETAITVESTETPSGSMPRKIPSMPAVSRIEDKPYYIPQGPVSKYYEEMHSGMWSSAHSTLERFYFGLRAGAASVPALLEESFRAILNMPAYTVTTGENIGQYAAQAKLYAERGRYADAAIAVSKSLYKSAEGFAVLGSVFIGLGGKGTKVPGKTKTPVVRTRRQALKQAKGRADIPSSQQPTRQWQVGSDPARRGHKNYKYNKDPASHGRYYEFDTPKGKRIVVEHSSDPKRRSHTHAGQPKVDPSRVDVDFKVERYQQVGGKHHIEYGGRK